MSLQALCDALSAGWRTERSASHLTLGGLIENLRAADPAMLVRLDFCERSPVNPHSYRGYYSDLSFEPFGEPQTVAQVLHEAEGSLNQTFQGWKGGDFYMDDTTPLWIAEEGCCGRAVVGAEVRDGAIVLLTKEDAAATQEGK